MKRQENELAPADSLRRIKQDAQAFLAELRRHNEASKSVTGCYAAAKLMFVEQLRQLLSGDFDPPRIGW